MSSSAKDNLLSGFLPNNLGPESHELRHITDKYHNRCWAIEENGQSFNLENFSSNEFKGGKRKTRIEFIVYKQS